MKRLYRAIEIAWPGVVGSIYILLFLHGELRVFALKYVVFVYVMFAPLIFSIFKNEPKS